MKKWEEVVKDDLQKLASGSIRNKKHETCLHEHFRIEFTQMNKCGDRAFVQIGDSDDDRGGWVDDLLKTNILYCIEEKTGKIAKYKSSYPKWWLVLVDFIVDGRPADDRALVPHPGWDRVIVIHPYDYSLAYDV